MAADEHAAAALVAQTPLTRYLATVEPARRTPVDAFRLARRWFLAGRRLDMQDLTAELGISRATLFRWVGNRDQLIAEILWSMAEPTLAKAAAEASGRGGRRIAAIVQRFNEDLIASEPFRTYLAREAEGALRLLTTRASVVQRRLVAKFVDLLAEEVARGDLDPPMAVPDLAYLVVRIGESFAYADLITGEQPDASKPAAAIAVLLR
jgi:AcrR family transcriptional regulator